MQTTIASEAGAQYRVLLVEDSPESVTIVKAFLNDPRIHLTVSYDGADALAIFKTSTFDLVLMDILMPELDGCETTVAIRQWEAENSLPRTPITALTASSTPSEVDRIFSSGCSSYLRKPITRTILLQTAKQFLIGPPKCSVGV